MGILDIFRRNPVAADNEVHEKRASASGFTAEIIAARESYLSGSRGVAELTGTVQSCVSLWEGALAQADVAGTDLLTRADLAMTARGLALRGEALFLIDETEGLIPASDWDLSTRHGRPRAYRVSISEAGGGYTRTALAAEVLHFRIGVDPVTPYFGQAPLRRAALTAGMLQAVEEALREVYENAPIGSMIVPFPESREDDLGALGRGFRGRRGRVLLRESVNVSAAGGPAPAADWKPADVSPDLSRAMTRESLDAARGSILGVFGVLPALMNGQAQGPLVREAQRHLATWVLQPIASVMADEARAKLGAPVEIDLLRPLQAFDAGGRARAFAGYVEALASAKQNGLTPGEVAEALRIVNWD